MEKINVKGMSCQHCVKSVTEALEELGLEQVTVNLEEGTATFTANPNITLDHITEAIDDIGFEVE